MVAIAIGEWMNLIALKKLQRLLRPQQERFKLLKVLGAQSRLGSGDEDVSQRVRIVFLGQLFGSQPFGTVHVHVDGIASSVRLPNGFLEQNFSKFGFF